MREWSAVLTSSSDLDTRVVIVTGRRGLLRLRFRAAGENGRGKGARPAAGTVPMQQGYGTDLAC
jgi:hypothetical protein